MSPFRVLPKFQFKRDLSVGAQNIGFNRPVSGSSVRTASTSAQRLKSPFFFSISHGPDNSDNKSFVPRPRSVIRVRDALSTMYSNAPPLETNFTNAPMAYNLHHQNTPGRNMAMSVTGITTMSRRTATEWNSIEERLAKRVEDIAVLTSKIRVPPELIKQVETLRARVEKAREELERYNRDLIAMGEQPVE